MLRVLEPIDKARPGDIISWKTPAHKDVKLWKVVQNWTQHEPRQLLVTEVDGEAGKCYTVLAADCEVVENRDAPAPSFTRTRREREMRDVRELPNHRIPKEEPV